MLSVAPVRSAAGAAGYFASDNYYTVEQSSEESQWAGAGAEMLGLTESETIAEPKDEKGAEEGVNAESEGADKDDKAPAEKEAGEAGQGVEGADLADGPAAEAAEKGGAEPPRDNVVGEGAAPVVDAVEGGKTIGVWDQPESSGQRVTKDAFEAILNGKLPDGTQVGDPGKRQIGMDLTFSMPKSASVLAYIGGDKRILDVHMLAVKATMKWAEKNLAEGRIKKDGVAVPIRTGNLTYALFQHDTSRALDPQGHIHAVIANMTRMPDGSWRALHNGQLWQNNTVLGSIYHANFRAALEKLGYQIETGGKHGTFEIKGVPEKVLAEFSKRTADIEREAARLGITSREGLQKVKLATRDPKLNEGSREAMSERWKERAAELGFDGKSLIDASIEKSTEGTSLVDRGRAALETAFSRTQNLLSNLRRPTDPLVDRGLARLGLTPVAANAQLVVASAVRTLSQREAAYSINQLSKTALDYGVEGVTIDTVETRITQLIAKGELIPEATKREDRVVEMVTTREALATEMGILREVDRGKSRVVPFVDASQAASRLQVGERELNTGQLAAATMILSSRDRIIAVQGIAGAGKSTMLAAVAGALRFENRHILGLAFQNKMVKDLSEGAGIEARTVASFIMANERHLGNPNGKSFEAARARMAGGYLILDEASMVSNEQTHKLTRIANLLGVDKLVLVGDRQQLSSIDAGKSFALMQESGTKTARMEENLRQRTETLRTVAMLANVGRAGEAIRTLGDAVSESTSRASEAGTMWLNLSKEDRENTGLFASGRETRSDIVDTVQKGLREEGTLKGAGVTLTVYDRVNSEREALRYTQTYKVGQTVDVRMNIPEIGLNKGQYDVTRTFKGGKVEVRAGRRTLRFDPQRFDPKKTEERIALAQKKDVTLYEGDKIRWTAKDKARGLENNDTARVLAIGAGGITVERSDKSVLLLKPQDPMLKRLDLAYALNMHMAEGITIDKGIGVMGSQERFLSNQRLFNVMVTRVRDDIKIVTDDKAKLVAQIERTPGNKTSALETIGSVDIDRAARPPREKFDPDISSLTMPSMERPIDKLERNHPGLIAKNDRMPEPPVDARKEPLITPLPVPEKTKGLER